MNELKIEYEELCNVYADVFKLHMGYNTYYWIDNEIGGTADFNNCYTFNFETIRYVVDNDIPVETVNKWCDYTLNIEELYPMSLEKWIKTPKREQ